MTATPIPERYVRPESNPAADDARQAYSDSCREAIEAARQRRIDHEQRTRELREAAEVERKQRPVAVSSATGWPS